MTLEEQFKKTFKPYKKMGWYLASSPSQACKYVIDEEGNKCVISFSNKQRMIDFLALVR